MPVVIGFSNTSFKTGRQLLSLCQFSGDDMFRRKYKLSSKRESNQQGTYYIFTVSPNGRPSEEEFNIAEGLWKAFSAKDIQIHIEETIE